MKISKTAVLTLSCVFSIAGLGLMIVSADAPREISTDLDNAIQHIENVILISDTGKKAIFKQKNSRLVEINTDNFVLSTEGDNKNEIFKNGTAEVNGSTVLGGIKNKIWGSYNVILGGEGNMVTGATHVILGGEGNSVGASANSVIAGGRNNRVNGASSVIVGGSNNELNGSNSLIVGSNSSVDGDSSAALGLGSRVNANKSFLWTDGNGETLSSEDVFAVVGGSGMVVGLEKAHSLAQLTLGGPIRLHSSADTNAIQCGAEKGGGNIKAVADGSNICLCSCDGSGRNSLFAFSRCKGKCDINIHPKCGNAPVTKFCTGGQNTYTGSCEQGKVVEGSGAYFVDRHSIVHWACQTENGEVLACSTGAVNIKGNLCQDKCGGTEPKGDHVMLGNSDWEQGYPRQWTYVTGTSNPSHCQWTCLDGFEKNLAGDGCRKKCAGPKPEGQGYVTNSNDYYTTINGNVNGYTEWKYIGNPNLVNSVSCAWSCADGYEYDTGSNTCNITLDPVVGCTELNRIPEHAHRNNDLRPSTSTQYYYNTNENLPCTYMCDDDYNYNAEQNKCLRDDSTLCGDAHYDCKPGAYLVPGSTSSLTQNFNIVYKWKCQKASISENCEEKFDIGGPEGCYHCAYNGFPYCFPINFGGGCKEGDYY